MKINLFEKSKIVCLSCTKNTSEKALFLRKRFCWFLTSCLSAWFLDLKRRLTTVRRSFPTSVWCKSVDQESNLSKTLTENSFLEFQIWHFRKKIPDFMRIYDTERRFHNSFILDFSWYFLNEGVTLVPQWVLLCLFRTFCFRCGAVPPKANLLDCILYQQVSFSLSSRPFQRCTSDRWRC